MARRETKQQFKERMQRIGLWGDFVRRRTELQKAGVSPKESNVQAAQEMDERATQLDPGPEPDSGHAEPSAPTGNGTLSVTNDTLPPQALEPMAIPVEPCYRFPMKEWFDGRPKSNPQADVKWVAANLQVLDPCPDDCPSAEAWGILIWARTSHANTADFWKTMYPKVMPRAREEGGSSFEDDGQSVLDLIDKFLERYQAARGKEESQAP